MTTIGERPEIAAHCNTKDCSNSFLAATATCRLERFVTVVTVSPPSEAASDQNSA